ncbi:MAG TPA: photosynthetic reaction center cytochrome c subunit family protein [Burkholderiaceae bacterium]|nr:photosynthetic reaction center cytochrome c subunit family protein [Burkholderiaceae bacterium]
MNRSGGKVAIVLALIGLIGVVTVRGQAQSGTRVPMAEEVFKNIQVLKGIPEDEFMGTMGIFASSLGKNCSECHGQESGGNWALYANDTPLKQTARRMVTMTKQINDANFGGRQVVTCYSCHRGLARPKVTPSLVALYATPPDEPEDIVVANPNGPKADDIFDKYLAAIGGAARVAALTSYTAKGTYKAFDDAEAHPLEVSMKAPNQRAWLWHGGLGDHGMVYNGRDGWTTASLDERPFPVELLSGQELDGARFEVELAFPTRIKQALTGVRVGLPASIGDKDYQVVQGRTPAGTLVTLYFDMESGLLARLMHYTDSPVGRIVTQYDYDDYRPVAGVRIPFKWTRTWLDGRSQFVLTDVQPNVAIPADRFALPPSARPAAQR